MCLVQAGKQRIAPPALFAAELATAWLRPVATWQMPAFSVINPGMHHYDRRFSGIGRLYGKEGLERSRRAHVCVIGLGGVGSWAVEALARSGIGELTLVDLDDVCISNVNRQLHALDGELGKPKVEVLARRVRAINPDCVVHPLQAFFLKSNACEILQARYDYVLDAIDSPARKCLLIALCREKAIPVITTGASAGRRDPTAVQVMDLAFSSHDRLLQEVRKKLRTRHGFPRGGASVWRRVCRLAGARGVSERGWLGLWRPCPGPGPPSRLRHRLRHGVFCDRNVRVGRGVAYCTEDRGGVRAGKPEDRRLKTEGGQLAASAPNRRWKFSPTRLASNSSGSPSNSATKQ